MPADFQSEFSAALFDPARPVPAGAVDPNGLVDAKRFAVYRNNVISSLADAVEDGYPIVRKIVGEAFSRAMAQEYVRRHPPKTPLMIYYGHDFADFVADFPPAASVPYLADIARLEYAQRLAYFADDAQVLPTKWWANLPQDAVPNLKLTFHPSVRALHSAFPIYDIWVRNARDEQHALAKTGQDLLITRLHDVVATAVVPMGTALFIDALSDGDSVAGAAGAVLDANPSADIPTMVAHALPLVTNYE